MTADARPLNARPEETEGKVLTVLEHLHELRYRVIVSSVALVAGIVGIPFRTFAAIDIAGRSVRFTVIVLVAHLAAS